MAVLSLKVRIADRGVVKTMQFDPATLVYDACKIIRDKMPEAQDPGQHKEYGLFLADEDPKKGVWMESGRSLEYYLVRSGDLLEYKKKTRTLRVRMLDGAVKTMLVDDSQPVGQLMVVVCTRIGITNHDEYSLVREGPAPPPSLPSTLRREESKGVVGTLTLGRSKEKKMEALRKALHTDEELNWVEHSKTLREQGVEEDETLLLRRKYFFSDQNVDSRDPVQLNLLYVQCRDGVINGSHPVSRDEAFALAALQCQIQFGDHVDSKHKYGFLDLREFLPKEYAKVRESEKRVLAEYRGLKGMNELDAKVRYVHKCRSLNTYGVTFFLVKEKMKGKNKLVPRLLGINKDCVMRVDEKTKEVMKVWPLEQVRRWAASPNTFTLDFGDYQDAYYSVQTLDGEKIAQLIAGYIDIILKKKRAKDHFGIEGDEGSTMLEDNVAPAKATLMSHGVISAGHGEEGNVALPGVMRQANGAQPYELGAMQGATYGAVQGQVISAHPPPGQQPKVFETASKSQRALVGTIEASVAAVERAEEELEKPPQLPPLEKVSEKWKQDTMQVHKATVEDQLAAMGAATAHVVQLTAPADDKIDHTAVGAAINTISSNLPDMTRGVKTVAALMPEEDRSDTLLQATRKLCGSFSDFLHAVNPDHQEPDYADPGPESTPPVPPRRHFRVNETRQTVLAAAGRVGDYSHAMKQTMEEPTDEAKEFQDRLVQLAKAVATSTAQLVLKAKNVSSACQDQSLQDRVIHSATQCAFATSQLVACARVVAPTIDSPACQQQLIEAAKQVAKAVDQLLQDAEAACQDERSLGDLRAAAAAVTAALNHLLSHIKTGPRVQPQQQELETIITSTDRIIGYSGSANDMVRQAKVLAEATTHLVSHIKGDAETSDSGADRDRLLGAARRLADATSKMINATKTAASDPAAPQHQAALRDAAEDLRSATSVAAGDQLRRSALQALQQAARQTATHSTQLIQAANNAGPSNRNPDSSAALSRDCVDASDHLPRLIQAVAKSSQEPNNTYHHSELLLVCREVLDPAARLVSSGRAAVGSCQDEAAAMHLSQTTVTLSETLATLRTALTRFQISSGTAMDLGQAIEVARGLDKELEEMERSAAQGRLYPVPGETIERSTAQLTGSTKSVGASMAQLLSASVQGDAEYVGMCARDATEGLRQLTQGIHGVCSTRNSSNSSQLIHAGRDVMTSSAQLFQEVQATTSSPDRPDNQERLARVARQVTKSLNACLSCLPGQADIDAALQSIKTLLSEVNTSQQIPASNRSAEAVQEDLVRLASQLSEATSRLAGSSGAEPHILAEAIRAFIVAFQAFFKCALEMVSHQEDPGTRAEMMEALRALATESVRLLDGIKQAVAEPWHGTAGLNSSAQGVTAAINRLLDICATSAAWQAECDNAIRRIQTCRHLMEPGPQEPVSELSYYACLQVVTEKSKDLGEGMTGIAQHAKQGQVEQFGSSVSYVAEAVCGLAESAAQAAYLVAVSDPGSVPGRPGLVDSKRLQRNIAEAREACNRVSAGRYTQQEVLEDATAVARHTSNLTSICKDASSRTNNPSAKRHFVNCARDVAANTAALIKSIKALDSDFSGPQKQHCSQAANALSNALDSLASFVASPEFASLPAKISPAGLGAQRPITQAGLRMLDGSCDMIRTAKLLAVNPRDPPTWQTLAAHSKTVSDSIKALVSGIRDHAPGQADCDQAIQRLGQLIQRIDQASLAAINQQLPAAQTASQASLDPVTSAGMRIQESLGPLETAAKSEAEVLGHRVRETTGGVEALVEGCIGAASLSSDSRAQMQLMSQVKSVAEAGLQCLYSAKDAGGNPAAREFWPAVEESVGGVRETVGELLQSVQAAVSEAGIVSSMVESLSRAIARCDAPSSDAEQRDFVDCQTRMVRCCQEIARIAAEMVAKSYGEPGSLGPLALELSRNYAELAEECRGITAANAGSEVSSRIRGAVQELGQACILIVKSAGSCRASPQDDFARKELGENSSLVKEKVALVLAALQAGSRGTQACINAASTVSGIIGDLDTTIMFASAGTLNPSTPSDHFSDHREGILKTAKALVEDTKALVSGAASSQEQLAVAAQNAVRTIVGLSDVVKSGAASLTSKSSEAQVLVIHAVKDVAAALASLIQATKNASGKSFNDPAMTQLKDAAKVMVTNVTSLLKTVKTVEDEEQRGTRALEAAVEAIAQEIRAFDGADASGGRGGGGGNPEELLRVTKPVTEATGRAMAAASSLQQDDVIAAANLGRKVVSDVLVVTKAAALAAESPELRYKAMDAARDLAIKLRQLLQGLLVLLSRPQPDGAQQLLPASRSIAQAVTDLVAYAELLKGEGWEDPADPTLLAESELLGAANSIEAAASKLAQLRPRQPVKAPETNEDLRFDEQILSAAGSIAEAVQLLVRAAGAAQRELVAQGRTEEGPGRHQDWEDYQWSEGLVSAARLVAAAVHSLCEAANALVQGHASEERLISAAKQVAASTAQLLVACKVKADVHSKAMQRLQAAGQAVKTATEHLVAAAKQSIEAEEERNLVVSQRMVGGIAQVMDAQEAVLRKEKELEEARVKLSAIRKAKYEANPPGSHSPSPDPAQPFHPTQPYYSDF